MYSNNYTDYPSNQARPDIGGQVTWLQSLLIQNYAANKYIVIDKEIKGGLHRVKYKSQLIQDAPGNTGAFIGTYDGIFSSRRAKGMLVYVELEDDDSPCDKYYSMTTYPGTSLAHWTAIGSPSATVFSGFNNVANLAARDALTGLAAGIVVNVTDARSSGEIASSVPVYSATYLWANNTFNIVYPYRDINSHVKNHDTQLMTSDGPLDADDIKNHIDSLQYHKLYNDLTSVATAKAGSDNEAWSSKKVATELDKKLDIPTGDGSLFLANDGTYKLPTGGNGGGGLSTGDVLFGGTSQLYAGE